MIKSMTGYGRGIAKDGTVVEIKSINHRFKEINVKLSSPLPSAEERIKALVSSKIQRGKIDVHISFNEQSLITKEVKVDWALAEQIVTAYRQAKERFQKNDDVTLESLFHHEGVLIMEESENVPSFLLDDIQQATDEALSQLQQMRAEEGHTLYNDLMKRLDTIRHLVSEVRAHASEATDVYEKKLIARLKDMQANDAISEASEERLLAEVAILAEKYDITEELVRIDSHIHLFEKTLQSEEPVGRKLDFITQELHREANTIGSKSHLFSIAEAVILVKAELEKMKEQVQNIE
ncbi:YicC family protein [Bacillaceae bacterium SIJ1]|uniref:YicC/YloC family endoribonuclease n=1 Tax=Litoribacterium kuwaitense TaxID=1398745 RepID=UPI0013E9FE8C|nr:YicC/YloC family endoribonuclease [Litoribacterium kuwaitense]NGP44311.1 YicC family protein [Litoribacterium kuwaitense]